MQQTPESFKAASTDSGKRLDQFLVAHLPDISRARIQHLIDQGQVRVNGKAAKASHRLRADEVIAVRGPVEAPALRAIAENIPLDVRYEDDDLVVVNKPAGMMVHAGAGATDDARNRGTLVNALLHRFAALSRVGGELRPGIVHRLDRETSGLLLVAKNDTAHRKLSSQFARREVKKMYLALVQGWPKNDQATIKAPIRRDSLHRKRMTTRGSAGREAISHYTVLRRIESYYGKFALLEVRIDTGRTHQIRVHLSSLGHPVVGDKLYGASALLKIDPKNKKAAAGKAGTVTPSRNFLHAARLQFAHPETGEAMAFSAPLPPELEQFMSLLEAK
jgi:23S rRNA pseudouridine1911/1915/1917 synthase